MKRRITLSIALALSVFLLSQASSNSIAKAAPPLKFNADSGIITLGPNQMLRLTVANGLDTVSVRFRRIEYGQDGCDTVGVCKHVISSQAASNLITLAPGEGARFDIAGHEGADVVVRAVVSSNSQDARVTATIIDTTTGKVEAIVFMFYND